MKDDYKKLIEFWDNALSEYEPYELSSWVEDEKFIEIINNYIDEASSILDYGCGSGWALFEIWSRTKFKDGLGIDTASKVIDSNNLMCKYNNINNVKFLSSDETILDNYKEYFDFVISINLLDVVPDEIINSILDKIYESMKINSILFVGLNPDFSIDELINLIKLEQKGSYFYKEDVLRCNKKSILEWYTLFERKFEVLENFKFMLTENEKMYPRVGFLLKKK